MMLSIDTNLKTNRNYLSNQSEEDVAYRTLKYIAFNSHFQLIFNLSNLKPIGYEGLIRGKDKNNLPLPPDKIFYISNQFNEEVEIDRYCRKLHIENFAKYNSGEWIFLNIHPNVIINAPKHGAYFKDLLNFYEISPSNVVIEILEDIAINDDDLNNAVQYYRDLGCLIAIDDFGAGHSNIERVMMIKPNIVKLDRTLLLASENNSLDKNILTPLVSMFHKAGILVVLEGIETIEQAQLAIDANVDMVQGYLLHKPEHQINVNQEALAYLNKHIYALFMEKYISEDINKGKISEAYIDKFLTVLEIVEQEKNLNVIAELFSDDVNAVRCYIIDSSGYQVDANIDLHNHDSINSKLISPLQETKGANWSGKSYFRQAISMPNQIHISTPYMSVIGLHRCVTISKSFQFKSQIKILCLDINIDGN